VSLMLLRDVTASGPGHNNSWTGGSRKRVYRRGGGGEDERWDD
jgi:hypothetical protein